MKVIFLDIDGVLNTEEYRSSAKDYFEAPICQTHMHRLGRLARATGAEIVLISFWRQYWNEGVNQVHETGQYLNETFAAHGLSILSKTLELPGNDRKSEVDIWLDEHANQVDSFVILDDTDYGYDKNAFVETSDTEGFDDEAFERALQILQPCYTEKMIAVRQWRVIREILWADVDEEEFSVIDEITVDGYFTDSKTLLLCGSMDVCTYVKENEGLSADISWAVKRVFGEESKFILDLSAVSEGDSYIMLSCKDGRKRLLFNPFADFSAAPDVKAYKIRKLLRRELIRNPGSIFGVSNVHKEMLYRLLLIFVNAAHNGITELITVKRGADCIEISSADEAELLVERVAGDQLFSSSDYERYITFNRDKKRRYLDTPFYKCASAEGDSSRTANVDSYFTLFALTQINNYVCIESVRDGKSKSVFYKKTVTRGIEYAETNRRDGTYITFDSPADSELSNSEICEVIELLSAISGVRICFLDTVRGDGTKGDFKNIAALLDRHRSKKDSGSFYGKIEAGGKDRFDGEYYNARVELAFNLTRENPMTATCYNYSFITDKENVFSDKLYSELTEKLNRWLNEKSPKGVLTKADIKKHTGFVINITDGDLEKATLEGAEAPKFRRMLDDMLAVIIEDSFSSWLEENLEGIIEIVFEILDEKEEAKMFYLFPDGMK